MNSIHKKLGMRILTEEDVKGLRSESHRVKWVKDTPFEPRGVALEEAQKGMEKICKI